MTIFKKAIPRRTVLKVAGAALALPLLDAMVPAFAGPTDTAAKPAIRMGFMYVPNGIILNKWTPDTEGANFEMTPILEPLTPFRDRFLVLSGLDQKNANMLPGEGGAFHSRATATFLTGVHPKPTEGVDMRGGVSVDQIAAKELGKQTQLASLEMCLDPVEAAGVCEPQYTCAYMNTISWRTPTTPMPMEDHPRVVFERLFGDSETTDPAARRARIEEDRSLLDSLTEGVARFRSTLAPSDRPKLGEYLDAVRDVERRIQLAEQQSARELPTLERPAGGVPGSFEDHAKLMMDLQVLAFQTDLTRVITFMIAHDRSPRSYPEIGIPEAHHALSHHRGDPASIAKLVQLNTYHVNLFKYYLDKLRSTPDGDFGRLDHSMIVYGAGIADGNLHTEDNLPKLLLGGGAGHIKSGATSGIQKVRPCEIRICECWISWVFLWTNWAIAPGSSTRSRCKITFRHRMNTQVATAVGRIAVCGLLVVGVASALRAQDPPIYKVDPFWPKPLPNKW